MNKTCATCKHCIWVDRGGHKCASCAEYTDGRMLVVCDPPWDEACPKYEEVTRNENYD